MVSTFILQVHPLPWTTAFFCFLEKIFFLQDDRHNTDQDQSKDEGDPPELIQGKSHYVHAIEAEYDIGDRQQNGDRGQHLHDDV